MATTDCKSPQCHEEIRLCLHEKVSKHTLWLALWAVFVVVFIPLFLTGIKVWSQQENSHLKFAEKKDLAEIDKRQTEIRAVIKNMVDDVDDIKKSQEEAQKDIKEILRHLRDKGNK